MTDKADQRAEQTRAHLLGGRERLKKAKRDAVNEFNNQTREIRSYLEILSNKLKEDKNDFGWTLRVDYPTPEGDPEMTIHFDYLYDEQENEENIFGHPEARSNSITISWNSENGHFVAPYEHDTSQMEIFAKSEEIAINRLENWMTRCLAEAGQDVG